VQGPCGGIHNGRQKQVLLRLDEQHLCIFSTELSIIISTTHFCNWIKLQLGYTDNGMQIFAVCFSSHPNTGVKPFTIEREHVKCLYSVIR